MTLSTREIFKLLESIATGKRVINQKLIKKETPLPVLNSPNFEDPYEKLQKLIGEDNVQKV